MIMYSFHVVPLIPAARKAIAVPRSLTVAEFAHERVQSVIVKSMGLSLVPEEASIGRKSGVLAFSSFSGKLAPVWLQVGIQVLAAWAWLGRYFKSDDEYTHL